MPINAEERQSLLDQFHAGSARLEQTLSGLSPAQMAFKESPERWSIAENVEHIVRVEQRILGRIQDAVSQASAPTPAATNIKTDEQVRAAIQNRTSKFPAPEPARPTGEWKALGDLRAAFAAARARTLDFVSTTAAELRHARMPHPVFGDLDAYQWLIAVSHHSDRHIAQVGEIKDHFSYPTA